jgi:hypothetical protein
LTLVGGGVLAVVAADLRQLLRVEAGVHLRHLQQRGEMRQLCSYAL